MKITLFNKELIPQVSALMRLGSPFINERTLSDYWTYTKLFSSSCPIALIDNQVVGAVIAFRSQENPDDVYIQEVLSHPDHRRKGIARALLAKVEERAVDWGCKRLYLTSRIENTQAHTAWASLGFENLTGDKFINGVSIFTDYKGLGQDRVVYQRLIR